MTETIREKTVAESYTTRVEILGGDTMNGAGRLFGGKLMEWIDVTAAVVARRHSNRDVTTATVDHLEFQAPAELNSTVLLEGRITYVGRTSMEVRVDTFVESLEGVRRQVNRAYLTLVALDEKGRPTPVPMLKLETTAEKQEWAAGCKRREMRLLFRQGNMLSR